MNVGCDKVLWLDNDIEVRHEIDHIFQTQAPAFAVDNRGAFLNSGVFVLDITLAFVRAWEGFVGRRYKSRGSRLGEWAHDGSDQELWFEFFLPPRRMYQLPSEYNANRRSQVNRSAIRVAHFILGEGGKF